MSVAKLTATGALDTTYAPTAATPGISSLPITGNTYTGGMNLYSDGTVLVVGYTGTGTNADVTIARFTPTGALDATFGVAGVVNYGAAGVEDEAADVAVDALGNIYVVGVSGNNSLILGLTSTGALNHAFGTNGVLNSELGGGVDQLSRVVLDASGKLVVGGTTTAAAALQFMVGRFSAAGVADATFGVAGLAITTTPASLLSLRIQADGKILYGGSQGLDAFLGRLNTDGSVDIGFATNGFFTDVFGGFAAQFYDIQIDSEQRIVVCGEFAPANPSLGVARLNP